MSELQRLYEETRRLAASDELPHSTRLALAQKAEEWRHYSQVTAHTPPSPNVTRQEPSAEHIAKVSAINDESSFLSQRFGSCVDPALYRAITEEAASPGLVSNDSMIFKLNGSSKPSSLRSGPARDLSYYNKQHAEIREREEREQEKARQRAIASEAAAQQPFYQDDSPQPTPYTFPHDGEVLDSASTLFHRLFETLRQGSGTTVLTLSSMTSNARQGMIEEGKFHNFLELSNALSSTTPRILFLKEINMLPSSWKSVAASRQNARNNFHNPVLSRTNAKLLKEKLNFSVDRQPGLLDFIGDVDSARLPGEEGLYPRMSTSSSVATPSPPHLFTPLGQPLTYFSTTVNDEEPWVMIDVRPWTLCITGYALASHHPVHAGACPRNWTLEGSFDGKGWITLSTHNDDATIDGCSNFGCWGVDVSSWEQTNRLRSTSVLNISNRSRQASTAQPTPRLASLATSEGDLYGGVPPELGDISKLVEPQQTPSLPSPPCRLFRIRGHGSNSLGGNQLQVAALEFYGRALCFADGEMLAAPATYFGESVIPPREERRKGMPTPTPLPPEPVMKKGKKGKKKK